MGLNAGKTAAQRIVHLDELMEQNRVKLGRGKRLYLKIKRICDCVMALTALAVLSPVMLLTVAALKLSEPREPVIFKQLRVGKNYKVFWLYKFRSMVSEAPKNVASAELPDPELYLTKIGSFLRRTSIDELPQLWNVIKGDMSLVGPRPLVYTEREIRFLRRYYGIYQVRPGITGQAQVNGRDYLSIYVKTAFDRYYLEHFNPWMDFKLMVKTTILVFLRAGIVEGATANEAQSNRLLDAFMRMEEAQKHRQ